MVERENVPLFHGKSILRGFLAGSLILAGIFNPYGLAVQAVLLIVGVLVFVESIISIGEATFIVSVVVSAIMGLIVYYALFLMDLQLYYIILMVIVAILIYIKIIYTSIKPL